MFWSLWKFRLGFDLIHFKHWYKKINRLKYDLFCNSFELPIARAWIGFFSPEARRGDPNPGLDTWMTRHSLANFDHFIRVVQGRCPIIPFFPVTSSYQNSMVSAVIQSIYPPSPEKPNHFGLVKIIHGPLAGEIVAFEPDDLYIFNQNMGKCKDLSSLFWAGVEVKKQILLYLFTSFCWPQYFFELDYCF